MAKLLFINETNYILMAFLFLFSCSPTEPKDVYGCTDSTACNFDELANTDDGTCEYPEQGFDCNGNGSTSNLDCLNGKDLCLSLNSHNLNYVGTSNIAGFQFNHDGCLTDPYAQGGDATSAGFTVSGSASTILAFSFTGSVVPAGTGTLVELVGVPIESCLSDFIFSDADGNSLSYEWAIITQE